jgi:hypothetical protein
MKERQVFYPQTMHLYLCQKVVLIPYLPYKQFRIFSPYCLKTQTYFIHDCELIQNLEFMEKEVFKLYL